MRCLESYICCNYPAFSNLHITSKTKEKSANLYSLHSFKEKTFSPNLYLLDYACEESHLSVQLSFKNKNEQAFVTVLNPSILKNLNVFFYLQIIFKPINLLLHLQRSQER